MNEVITVDAGEDYRSAAALRRSATANRVAGRLEFLSWLDSLIFDAASDRRALERRQLHCILAHETWVFGEQWALNCDDDRLTPVLAAHLHLLGEDVDLAPVKPLLREDDTGGIGDLVLSRTMQTAADRYEHLVVEMKRPAHTVTSGDVGQLRSYAAAVACDDRLLLPNVQWTYVLVGNSVTQVVDDQRQQLGQPYGRVQVSQKYSIWVRTWAEVISDARNRLKFAQQTLADETAHDRRYGVGDLRRRRHDQYLPPAMAAAAAGTRPD